MIEVTAKLIRGPVYLAGDTVECFITFANPPAPLHKRSQSNSDVLESLAWASAQIHCQCTTNSKVSTPSDKSVNNSIEERATVSADTSFAPCKGENGHVVVSTNPKILFCDLRLSSGESKTYSFCETLPAEAPPSYRGHAVKYSYKLTFGMQRVNCPIKLLRVSFRVLPLLAGGAAAAPDPGLCDSEDLTPSNPFLEAQQKETTHDLALQLLQNITARRSTNFYNITNKRGKVARFCLFKHNYKLGEDIVGVLDFSDASVTCVQLSVLLQSEEEVAHSLRRWPKQASTIVSYSKHHEVCLSLRHSHLAMPVPLHVTPTFNTELMSLKWRLHFEFVTSTIPHLGGTSQGVETWQGPPSIDIETMVWNLPIKVYATTPVFVAQGIQAQSKFSLTI